MKKIMLHLIIPNQISGPNTANRLIYKSELKEDFQFEFLSQSSLRSESNTLSIINNLRKQIKSANPDLVHLSGLQASGFYAVVAARLAGCKNILVTIRGSSGDALNINNKQKFIFSRIMEPLTLKLCSNFYTVSSEMSQKDIVKRNSTKFIGVIHNAAPKIEFDVEKARIKIRKEFSFSQDDFIVVVSGRMIYDKGISYISEAIEKIDDPSVKFVFIGDGEYCDLLKDKHKELISQGRVFVLGQRENVTEILSGCDIFLFATLHENLSNALLEAMSVGLPIIATRIGGNIEVVENERNGFLIDDRNSQAIVKYINLMKDNPDLIKRFSVESKCIIDEKFSQKVIYKKIKEVYNNML